MSNTPDYTRKAVDNYRKKFDMIQVRFPKGTRKRIEDFSDKVNDFIISCVLNELERLEMSSEQSITALEPFENDKTNISTISTDLPEIKRIKESEEMKELEDTKPSNEYLDLPELTGDEEVDNANFIKFIHEQQERNAKKRNNELII